MDWWMGGLLGLQGTLVYDTLGFAFGYGQGAGGEQLHLRLDPGLGFELLDQLVLQGRDVLDLAVKTGGSQLDFDGHVVEALDDYDVVAAHLREGHQHALDLLREDVHAADDEHVVGAASDAVEAAMGAPALAWLGNDGSDVPGAVAEDGHGLALQGSQDKLASLAFRQGLAGSGIDDLQD